MKSRFISDPQDPFGDGVLNTDGVDPNFFPASFYPAAGHDGRSSSAGASPAILPVPTPIAPVEAVQAQSAQNGPGGPGSVVSETSGGITFNLVFDAAAMTAPQSFRDGIVQAASILSATITNKITVNINIDYSGTGGGAAAGPDNGQFESYSSVKTDLINHAAPGDTTFNALPSGSSIQGQSSIAVWNAQLKLWGLLGANDSTTDDGSATFATDIQAGLLVGVALHELTHALGRVPYGPPYGPQPDIFDLFRFTSPGAQLINGASTAPAAYFSVDGGNTKIADYGQTSDPSDFLNSGVQGGNDPFNEFYTYSTLQTLTAIDKEQLDALGFNTTLTPVTTVIEAFGSTKLVEVGTNYYLDSISTGLGPTLKLSGANVVAGQFGGVAPIGAEQTAGGYEIAWKAAGADAYTVWNTDSSGNFISDTIGTVSGASYTLESLETSFQQDLNGDGHIGPVTTMIEAFGSTSLVQTGTNYYLDSISTGSGPTLKLSGANIVAGEFGGVAPIGAEQTAGGYEIAWKATGADAYTVWNTDSSGNFISDTIGTVSGASYTLESLETSFQQDLNGDGHIGPATTVIEPFGSTSLVQTGPYYDLVSNSTGSGPMLKLSGANVVAGEFGGVAPIGAEQTAGGYEIAWKATGADAYTVWNTDSSGNFISDTIGTVSGASYTLESLETSFQQDLNGDGHIGPTAIDAFGSTSLVEVGNNFYLDNISTGSGPSLKLSGADVVAGQFGAVAPIGAEQTAGGYEVAWKAAGADAYTVWNTDSSGNFISDTIGTVSGASYTLESLETSFHQDLNGDGVIGVPTATVGASATLEFASAYSGSVTFDGATGTLKLEDSSTFGGQIFNFTGTGVLSSSDQIDLKDIAFGSGTTASYTGIWSGGTLTISDTQNHTAHISLAGNYIGSTFSLSSDGNGGTLVVDPPGTQDLTSGTLSFNDTDLTDKHTVSISPQDGGAGYVGTFTIDAENTTNGQDSVGWHFNLDPDSITHPISQSYDVTLAETHPNGTNSTVAQVVSVTVGGPGCDTFVFHPGVGADVIANAGSADKIELDGFSSVTDINQLMVLLSDAQTGQQQSMFQSANAGHDTVINLGNHDSITLANVHIADLHAGNFIIH